MSRRHKVEGTSRTYWHVQTVCFRDVVKRKRERRRMPTVPGVQHLILFLAYRSPCIQSYLITAARAFARNSEIRSTPSLSHEGRRKTKSEEVGQKKRRREDKNRSFNLTKACSCSILDTQISRLISNLRLTAPSFHSMPCLLSKAEQSTATTLAASPWPVLLARSFVPSNVCDRCPTYSLARSLAESNTQQSQARPSGAAIM